MDIRYTLQHFQAAWVSNSHARTVTIPAGLTNSVMLIIKDCSNDLPWTTFTGITVNGSSAGIVDVVNSGSGLASQSIRAWRLNSPPAGTYDVSVNFNTMSANGGTLTIIVLDDVNQTTPIADTEWGSSGSVSSPIGHAALTTPSGGYAIFSAAVVGGTSLVPSVGTNVGSAGNAGVSYLLNGTSTTFSWTGGSPAPASIIAFSLTPAGGGDTTAPTLTGSITVSALTSTSYTLTWPAGSDNVAVTGYEVSLNGGTSYASVGNVLTTNITGRTPGSTDSVRVRAFDAAGNRSTPALSASVTLNAAAGTLTLTTPLCNNTGLISGRWVSATGIRLSIVNESTGNTVLVVTGRATDASGVLTAAITDAAIVTGQTYRILPSWSGNAGLSQVLTAT